jgi:hypothetical protein
MAGAAADAAARYAPETYRASIAAEIAVLTSPRGARTSPELGKESIVR